MKTLGLIAVAFIFAPSVFGQQSIQELLTEGRGLRDEFRYEESYPFLKEAYELAKIGDDLDLVSETGIALAYTYLVGGNPLEATIHLTEMDSLYGNEFDTLQMAMLKNRLGWGYSAISLHNESISAYEEARVYSIQLNDSSRIANALLGIAVAQQDLALFDSSIESAKKALSYNSTWKLDVIRMYVTLYQGYAKKSDFDEAYIYLIEAYNRVQQFPNSIEYRSVLYRFSLYYYEQNDLRKSLSYAHQGIAKSIETNDPVLKSYFDTIIGLLYSRFGEQERAISYHNAAIEYNETRNDQWNINNSKIYIALAFIRDKEFQSAEEILLDIEDQLSTPDQKLRAYNYLSDVYRNQKKYDLAIHYLNKAEQTVLAADGIYPDFIYFDKLAFPDEIIPKEEKLDIAFTLMEYYKSSGEWDIMSAEREIAKAFEPINADSAFTYAYRSLEKLERRRASTTSTTFRNLANSRWRDFYYHLAHWEVTHNNNYEKAFELIEQSKSRALFDQIIEHQRMDVLSPDDPASLKVLELEKKLDRAYQNLDEITGPNEDLLLLELEYEAALDLIASNIRLRNLEYPSLSNLEQAQDLLDRNSAIISYGLTEDNLYLFYISKDKVDFIPVQSEDNFQNVLSTYIEEFRDGIINQEEPDQLHKLSNQLTQLLIDPISEYLLGIENLVIIPDGPLHLLPFEALYTDGKYLIERFSVKYLPSVSVYNIIEAKNTNDYNRDILGIAGTGFESGDGFYGSSSQPSFTTLPYALAEVDSISRSFKDAMILKNEEVSEAIFKNISLTDFRFVHLATHGEINEFEPSQSGLVLSKKMGTEELFGEDGFLNAREISQLNIPADLVVLSACDTGNGKVINGEGVMGLQRSFLVGGASSVMVSLWSIFDRSTPTFMNHFYEHLEETEEDETSFIDKIKMYAGRFQPDLVDHKTLALQRTKIEMINHPYYSHPIHWAPFVLTGK